MRRIPRNVALLVVLAWPVRALAWGCDGHRIVALVAWANLTEAARTGVTALLRAHPIDAAARGCRTASPNVLADASTWADAARDEEPATASWHYVDVPLDAVRGDLGSRCPFGRCIVAALRRELGVLRSDAPDEARARALRFVVHLVGDVHQPLHATTNGDRGGNCVPVAYRRARPHSTDGGARWEPNLHGIWDVDLVREAMGDATPGVFAEALERRHRDLVREAATGELAPGTWAWETHEVGVAVAYGQLPVVPRPEPSGRVESCHDHDDVGRRMLGLRIRVDGAYVAAVRRTVERQLALAGARLALVLNRTWH